MEKLPSFKTHPVVVSLIVIIFTFAYTAVCLAGGWWLRMQMESRAELAVVLDDSKFMQVLEVLEIEWVNEFLQKQETFYENIDEVPDCIAQPMPQYYLDNDYGLQPHGEQAE